jgi:hypothetical protein
MNIPITLLPIAVIGATGGKNQKIAITAKQATMEISLFLSI